MNYKELLEKHNLLLSENNRLIEENNRLKAQLGITRSESSKNSIPKISTEYSHYDGESPDSTSFSGVNNTSDSISKIKLFMSLFKGRDDVYATQWENKKKTASGYSPVCLSIKRKCKSMIM